METILVFIAVAFGNYASANLHCFNCTNITDGFDCNTVTECHTGQDCYIERRGGGNDTRYSLGCMDSQHCPAVHPFDIVGRSVSTDCKKCCHETGCNKKFCEVLETPEPATTISSCTDSPGANCTRLATVLNICSDPHKAKDVCRKYCVLCDMVDGGWSTWDEWSPCSTSCGLGTESRSRQCNNPSPRHGGYTCSGQNTQQRSCFNLQCPTHGGWGSWNSWESCSASCGSGIRKRHRTCSNPPPSVYGHYCIGDPVDFTLCEGDYCSNHTLLATTTPSVSVCRDILPACASINRTLGLCKNQTLARQTCQKFCHYCGIVDGKWSDWGLWTSCSVSCGNGSATRTRSCSNPAPLNGGNICTGNTAESTSCTIRDCPVHGAWGAWASWTTCSSSCGTGITHRSRACDNPRPSLLGNNCFGESSGYGLCTVKACPVNGNWADWTIWSSCSATCGTGHKIRQRQCSNPAPTNGGSACSGPMTDQLSCSVTSCPVHGAWGAWASWTTCSSSCGTGITHRTRECNNPRPSLLGNNCFGISSEYDMCTVKPCPVNGHWTDWTFWSGCSVTCGSGHKTRQRYCLNPVPSNGGLACTGSTTNQMSCNVMSGPVNGQWSSWTSWSTCNSLTCTASGLSQRHRTCCIPPPSSIGRGCVGESTLQRICPSAQCDGQVRLVNGTQKSGRVEILYGGIWGTICDFGWDNKDAKVVCRMLGYSGGTAYCDAHFGQGTGRITLEVVGCTGSERTITECSHVTWLAHGCHHYDDAGVSCT